MNRIVFDLEANGFLETASKIWCIVAYNIDTGVYNESVWHDPESMENVYRELSKSDNVLIGHNICGYDLPLIKSLHHKSFTRVIDTYVVSRLFNPDRGFHSLADWGEKLGIPKVKQEQWEEWDENMLYRCREDVKINTKLYHALSKECKEDLAVHIYGTGESK